MSARKDVTIWCDGYDDGTSCGAWYSGDTAALARSELGNPGGGKWLVGLPGGRDLCPEHVTQKASDRVIGDGR